MLRIVVQLGRFTCTPQCVMEKATEISPCAWMRHNGKGVNVYLNTRVFVNG